jgi:uncharacterized protein with PIN domain
MSRIRKGYEFKFRTLLRRWRARRLEKGIQLLGAKAERLGASERISLPCALERVYEGLARKSLFRKRRCISSEPVFFCDAGLGGLARWLRAAGFEALWREGIRDEVLVEEARTWSAIVLSTDGLMMERRLLRDGIVPALWLPPTLTIPEQLELVFREFALKAKEPRCMSCGGELRQADKETLRERIPPRTYRWLDDYFLCARCGKLFWHGTHWHRIRRELDKMSSR